MLASCLGMALHLDWQLSLPAGTLTANVQEAGKHLKARTEPQCCIPWALQMEWELKIPQLALEAGAELISDEEPAFDMEWRDVMEFWEVLLYCC